MIKDFNEFSKLQKLLDLKTLYAEKNPFCVEIPTYAAKLRHLFPQLVQIDAEMICGTPSAE